MTGLEDLQDFKKIFVNYHVGPWQNELQEFKKIFLKSKLEKAVQATKNKILRRHSDSDSDNRQ